MKLAFLFLWLTHGILVWGLVGGCSERCWSCKGEKPCLRHCSGAMYCGDSDAKADI